MTRHVESAPLERLVEERSRHPVPLVSTGFRVEVVGGLAVVTATRLFRNVEKDPIEATMTFPVPFDAVVTDIVTTVGDRVLVGKAVARAKARETYEDAIDRGKAAVLHEELLRGLHMISVANVAPKMRIEVATTFVMPLARVGGSWRARIPVTVGQIYGVSPLLESDDLVAGGDVQKATVKVVAEGLKIVVAGKALPSKGLTVDLDRPIEIELAGELAGAATGRAADGRLVRISSTPLAILGEVPLDAILLLDTSGSMRESASAREGSRTGSSKWDSVRKGIASASDAILTKADRLDLWTFSNGCRRVGAVDGKALRGKIGTCPFDGGGTELAGAVLEVTRSRSEANVLLVTDGKSWREIDVAAAIATGARFTVVLVGDDSLETRVGYLAALSGGQMFVTHGDDIAADVAAAIASMRDVASPAVPVAGKPKLVERTFGGVRFAVEWRKPPADAPERSDHSARVAAYAASLAMPGMSESEAAELAAAEGIVSHLTSIVLVDEAGEAVTGVPSTRKIALADPATSMCGLSFASASVGGMTRSLLSASGGREATMLASHDAASMVWGDVSEGTGAEDWHRLSAWKRSGVGSVSRGRRNRPPIVPLVPSVDTVDPTISSSDVVDPLVGNLRPPARFDAPSIDLVELVPWDADAAAISSGDLSGHPLLSDLVDRIAALAAVSELASALGRDVRLVAIGLVASSAARNRAAARIARMLLAGADPAALAVARTAAGL